MIAFWIINIARWPITFYEFKMSQLNQKLINLRACGRLIWELPLSIPDSPSLAVLVITKLTDWLGTPEAESTSRCMCTLLLEVLLLLVSCGQTAFFPITFKCFSMSRPHGTILLPGYKSSSC